ncbi:MAG: hypothetical protein ABI626_09410 [Sphingomicrobium sp.]
MTGRQLIIEQRFRGPPGSGNGGYVAGLVAGALGGTDCVVTLHVPPPLDRPMELRLTTDGAALTDGERQVASARRGSPELDIPDPPSLDQARAAESDYVGHLRHNFPACFVCGPERGEDDGLRIFPGSLDRGGVAGLWTPSANLSDADGMVRNEFLWSALDCPGYFAVEESAGLALLGRMAASIKRLVTAGQMLVVSGWSIASEGRKHHVGTAIHDHGELVACARSTWISVA